METTNKNTDTLLVPVVSSDYQLAETQADPLHRIELYIDFDARTMELVRRMTCDRSTSMYEKLGHAMSVIIPPMSKSDATRLLTSIAVLAEELCSLHAKEWRGDRNAARSVVKWDNRERARDLRYAIQHLVEEFTPVEQVGKLLAASAWLGSNPPEVKPWASHAELAEMANTLQAAAHAAGVHLWGLVEYVESCRITAERGQ